MYDIFGNDLGKSPNNETGKQGITPQHIDQRIGKQIDINKEYRLPLNGPGIPGIKPRFIGDTYYDTTNKIVYSAYGLAVGDWTTPVVVAVTGNLLLEDGSYVLLEDGNRILLDL